eukprot:7109311-Karenia_brevis.AAC.1
MESWFKIKVRAVLGPEEKDDKEVTIFGRLRTRPSMLNGEKEDKVEEWEEEFLGEKEAAEYRGLAARLNFMSLDWPDL